jgi:hypothetical protein
MKIATKIPIKTNCTKKQNFFFFLEYSLVLLQKVSLFKGKGSERQKSLHRKSKKEHRKSKI